MTKAAKAAKTVEKAGTDNEPRDGKGKNSGAILPLESNRE